MKVATWLRVTRVNGADLRVRLDAIDAYFPNGAGSTELYMRNGDRLLIDLDIVEQLDAMLSEQWFDVHIPVETSSEG